MRVAILSSLRRHPSGSPTPGSSHDAGAACLGVAAVLLTTGMPYHADRWFRGAPVDVRKCMVGPRAIGRRRPRAGVASQLPSVLDQADTLQILALVIVLLRDL